MLGWFNRYQERRKLAGRQIFRYFDGTKTRWVDPIVAGRSIEKELGEDWPKLLRVLIAQVPAIPAHLDASNVLAKHREAQEEAARKLSLAVCSAFEVQPFDGSKGLTEPERVGLAARFFGFLADLKESAAPFENSPSPTG